MRNSLGPGYLAITPSGSIVHAAGEEGTPYNFTLPVSTATHRAGPRIYPPGIAFQALQVSPGGKTLYALAANGFLDRIDAATGTPRPAICIRGTPQSMAITPDGRKVFVGSPMRVGHVVPGNAVTGIRGTGHPGCAGVRLMALAPGGRTLWAVGFEGNGAGTAVPIDTATDQPGRLVRVGDAPAAVVIVRRRVPGS